jgi:GTPase-associated protein 1, N-terminal domain type 2
MTEPFARGDLPDPRFAQLTYTSFDRNDGSRGGQQVKDTQGNLTVAEKRFLLSRVSTRLVEASVSPYPSADELAALPSRLLYAPAGDGGAGYWHTVHAGADSTGRPGNVFAHVVLDRRPGLADPPFRPSDLICSAGWLRPYGAQPVLEATLDGRPGPPWAIAGIDRAAAVSFLAGVLRERGLAVLAALLDAVDAAMDGGPTVVLGLKQPEHAGLWIAGVSHLMSPGTSRRFHWSTAEWVDSIGALQEHSVHLAVLALAGLPAVDPTGHALVISDDPDGVELGALDGVPHRVTRSGATIRVTPWSVIASVVLQSPELAARALQRQDSIAAEIGDRDLARGWPLAMAVAELPDELADAQEEARRIVAGAWPPGLSNSPNLRRAVESIANWSFGRTPRDALDAVDECADEAPTQRALAVRAYLLRAMHDRAWLRRPEGIPLPGVAAPLRDPELDGQALVAVSALAPRAGTASSALEAVRLVDLLVRAGLLGEPDGPDESDPHLRELRGHVEAMLARVGPLLLGTQGPKVVDGIGTVHAATQSRFIRPCLDELLTRSPKRPGSRLSQAVLSWLYPTPPLPPTAEELAAHDTAIPATLVELAAQVTRIVPDPSAFRLLALCGAVGPGADVRAEIDRLAVGAPWTAADLNALLTRFDPVELAPVLLPSLLTLPWGHDLNIVVSRVSERRSQLEVDSDEAARDLPRAAELRYLAAFWCESPDDRSTGLTGRLLDLVEQVLWSDPKVELAQDVISSVFGAHVVDMLLRPDSRPPRPALKDWVSRTAPGGMVKRAIVDRLALAIDHKVLLELDVIVAAQLSSLSPVAGSFGPPSLWQLGRLRVERDGDVPSEPILNHLVRRRLWGRAVEVPRLAEAASGAVERVVLAHGGAPNRVFAGHDRLFRSWWASLGHPLNDQGSGSGGRSWWPRRGESGDQR